MGSGFDSSGKVEMATKYTTLVTNKQCLVTYFLSHAVAVHKWWL